MAAVVGLGFDLLSVQKMDSQLGGPPPRTLFRLRPPSLQEPQQLAALPVGHSDLSGMALEGTRGLPFLRGAFESLVRRSASRGIQGGPPRAASKGPLPALFIRTFSNHVEKSGASGVTASSRQAAEDNSATCAAAAAATAAAGAPLHRTFTRTKQVATIGPASWEKEQIETLYLSGVDVFRLNFSHGLFSEKHQQYKYIREIEKKYNTPIAVLADLPGPKLRLGSLDPEEVTLQQGQEFVLDANVGAPGGLLRAPLQQREVLGALKVGDTVLIDDGKVKLKVIQVSLNQQQQQQQKQQQQQQQQQDEGKGPLWVRCVVELGGPVSSNKGVAVPNTVVPISALTDRDKEVAAMVSSWGVDFIAVSFVQEPSDLEALRTFLQASSEAREALTGEEQRGTGAPLLIAKIERQQALKQLHAIAAAADALMVARGDLGLELGPEAIPKAQKDIVEAARRHRKPVIVATQMLETMMHNPLPSRAEASDVATAVFDGADAVMLSGETAAAARGPWIAQMQQRLLKETENDQRLWQLQALRSKEAARLFAAATAAAAAFSGGPTAVEAQEPLPGSHRNVPQPEEKTAGGKPSHQEASKGPLVSEAVAEAAALMSRVLNAAAITLKTETGANAVRLSSFRPQAPIIAVTQDVRTARRLQLHWGVEPVFQGVPLKEGPPGRALQEEKLREVASCADLSAQTTSSCWLEGAKKEAKQEGFVKGREDLLVYHSARPPLCPLCLPRCASTRSHKPPFEPELSTPVRMQFLAVFWGALCIALASGKGASGSPRFCARQPAFVSAPLSCNSASVPAAVSRSPSSLVLSGPAAAAAAAASAAEKGARCYSYPLTFGGGARGGGEGEGRVALVTGASRGIGLAIAKTLAKGGVETVLCVARDQAACDAAASEVRGLGAASEGFGVDVSDGGAVGDLCRSLLAKYKHIDILVNNAGITRDNLFLRMKEEEWHDVINTNLNSAFYFTSPILKHMAQRRQGYTPPKRQSVHENKNLFGRIINMSSVVGVGGNIGQANYSASKAGLIGFTKSLAKEYAARNVTVNAIAPGFIKSAMTDRMTDAAKAATLASVPAGRLGTPQEIADLAAFLASDQSAYINGKVIAIDGAMLFGAN
ncbi:hypothetical protein Esti_002627 [Eimeria stiedai]